MEVLPLRGQPAFYATQAVHKLIFGLKMLPSYLQWSYPEFMEKLDAMPPRDQESYLREAAVMVKLEQDELEDLMQFCADKNGVPYCRANTKSLAPEQIHEIIVAVSLEILKSHKVRLLSEEEKKNSKISPST